VGSVSIGPVAVLQDVLLDMVESDNPSHTYDVTSKAVEDGANISDHMHERPTTLSISGYILGPDAMTRLSRIRQHQRGRRLVTYTNRVIHTNMAITNINTRHGSAEANGLYFTIQLKHVRRATPQQAQITSVPPSTASKASPAGNAGTKQPQQTPKQSNNKAADFRMADRASVYSGGGAGGGRGSGELTAADFRALDRASMSA